MEACKMVADPPLEISVGEEVCTSFSLFIWTLIENDQLKWTETY